MMRLLIRLMLSITVCLASMATPVATAQEANEEERLLKAVFIYNFAKFTRWPETVWRGEGEALTLCTAGTDPLATEVERLRGRMLKGHPLVVRSLQELGHTGECHVLYIAHSEKSHYRNYINAVQGKPVLTVSEIEGFGRAGGAIELYHTQDKIRFLINVAVAREAGLVISSRLLSLAEVIGMEGGP